MNEVRSILEWIGARSIRLVCLTVFGCVAMVSMSSCAALSCRYEAEKEVSRHKYNAESSKEFWRSK